MARFERNEVVADIPTGMYPVGEGFEAGRYYEQIDLGSRATVEGLARVLMNHNAEIYYNDVLIGYSVLHVHDCINFANRKDPGSYVVFTGKDESNDDIAYVYERVD